MSGDTDLTDLIPFSRPYPAQNALANLSAVLESDHAHGDGPFTASATAKLKALTGGGDVLLTTSGTHALEMASRLLRLRPGDEVILPSYTFPSAGDAIVAAGATCVFVDIDAETGNIDVDQVADAITPRTRAISVMHYGGMPVDLDSLQRLATDRNLAIIEDNAHGLGVAWNGGHLGRFGAFGVQSFHDTKNVHAGEGGALLINDPTLREAAEIMREKGTNRSQFLRGAVDKYSWVDWGSSYLPSEFNAAVLDAQLDSFDEIQRQRFAIWDSYRDRLADWADSRGIHLMTPPGGVHAAHLFYLLVPGIDDQASLISTLRAAGIVATFHYVPLHSSRAGTTYGRSSRPLTVSANFSRRLVRLPLWAGMSTDQVDRVIEAVLAWTPAMTSSGRTAVLS